MFLSYLNNFDIRQCEAQYLWLYYYQLSKINENNVLYVINKDYLKDYSTAKHRWERKYLKTDIKPLNYFVADKLQDEWESPTQSLKEYINEYQPLLSDYLQNNIDFKKFKAVLLWVNNNTIESIASKNGIPVIHNEIGPLREYIYRNTSYFDFKGVNGNTEFNARFIEFLKISHKIKLFNREELLKLVSPDNYSRLVEILHDKNSIHTGFPSQVLNDTNVLVYNNGWSLIDVMEYVNNNYNNLMIRNHPSANFTFKEDLYCTSYHEYCYDFINDCSKIVTLNSSVGFEALLLGRDVEILGESPFSEIPYYEEGMKLLALNFAVISYLIPSEYLFDEEYYNFRLKCFDEEELYNKGLTLWIH
jgi:hypothetical protein